MDENEEEINGTNEQNSGGGAVRQGAEKLGQKGKEKAIEQIKKKATKNATKAASKVAAKSSMMAALGPILFWVGVVIVVLIIIIGIIMFLLTMPGMVMEKLKALAKEVGNAIASFFGQDTTKQVDENAIYETLDYLQQMGYDLKGFGFLTDYAVKNEDNSGYIYKYDESEIKSPSDGTNISLNEEQGFLKDENDKVYKAKSDFINFYLISDNYVYTIRNFNSTNDFSNPDEPWYKRLLGGIAGLGQQLADFLTANQTAQLWSRGMIDIYYEGSGVGIPGDYFGNFNILNWRLEWHKIRC